MNKDCNLPKDLADAFARIYKELDLNNKRDFSEFCTMAGVETYIHLKFSCPHHQNIKEND